MDDKVKERFFAKVDKTDTCWLWNASMVRGGYGQFWFNNKQTKAHRVSWLIDGRTIPEGHVIRHKCRNRNCVKPEHLETGTHAENSADMIRDGTSNKGEKCHTAKLTVEKVLAIRARVKENQRELGEEFGVSTSTIERIISRRIWKHL